MPRAAASSLPIDNATITANDTSSTMDSENMSFKATASTNISSTLKLADEPFAVGYYRSAVSDNITSETQVRFTFRGNTTIAVPNSTETINTTDRGRGSVNFLPEGGGVIRGQFRSITEDRSENATVQFTEFLRNETFRGIGFAYYSTNSTGMLAPLNNMIAVFIDEEQPNGDSIVRFFELKSVGAAPIGNNNNSTSIGSGNDNTTTMTTTSGTPSIPTLYQNTWRNMSAVYK
jgi:hypothetical protein